MVLQVTTAKSLTVPPRYQLVPGQRCGSASAGGGHSQGPAPPPPAPAARRATQIPQGAAGSRHAPPPSPHRSGSNASPEVTPPSLLCTVRDKECDQYGVRGRAPRGGAATSSVTDEAARHTARARQPAWHRLRGRQPSGAPRATTPLSAGTTHPHTKSPGTLQTKGKRYKDKRKRYKSTRRERYKDRKPLRRPASREHWEKSPTSGNLLKHLLFVTDAVLESFYLNLSGKTAQ